MESTSGKLKHESRHPDPQALNAALDRVATEWKNLDPDVRISVQLVPELTPLDEEA